MLLFHWLDLLLNQNQQFSYFLICQKVCSLVLNLDILFNSNEDEEELNIFVKNKDVLSFH